MEITHKKYEGLNLIIVQGTLNKYADAGINEILLNTPATDELHLWVDCSDIKQIIQVNTSFSDFINYLLQLKHQGVQILLFGLNNNTRKMLALLKLDQFFGQAPTLDDAYLTLSQKLPVS